jgi:hypothetical protein
LRNGVLKAVSRTWEEYMRTPEFMEAMRESMKNSVQWKKMAKDSTNQMHTAMGSATKDDMQGVMEAVQHVEHRVLDHLEGMEVKMEDMQLELKGLQTQTTKSLDRYQEMILKQLEEVNKGLKAAAEISVQARKPSTTKTAAAKRTTVRKSPPANVKGRKVLKKATKTKTAKTKAQKK